MELRAELFVGNNKLFVYYYFRFRRYKPVFKQYFDSLSQANVEIKDLGPGESSWIDLTFYYYRNKLISPSSLGKLLFTDHATSFTSGDTIEDEDDHSVAPSPPGRWEKARHIRSLLVSTSPDDSPWWFNELYNYVDMENYLVDFSNLATSSKCGGVVNEYRKNSGPYITRRSYSICNGV